MSDGAAARKLERALSMAGMLFPNAVPVLAAMDVRLDGRVDTAAVTPSGRMLFSPAFLDELTIWQSTFVVAHELHHVLYGVFDRFDEFTPADRRRLVNVAHDFLVNDMLLKKFRTPGEESFIPDGALFWQDWRNEYVAALGRPQPPIESYSLESLVLELEKFGDRLPEGAMLERLRPGGPTPASGPPSLGSLGDALAALDGFGPTPGPPDASAPSPDARGKSLPELLSAAEEAALFPDETAVERASRRTRVVEAADLAEVRDALVRQLDAGRGVSPGDGDALVRSLDGTWSTPWERALQKWMDDVAPPVRSWAAASRRAGDRADVVLPGRRKDGFILHIVVDTSGSMCSLLPAVFGMIQSFGKTSGVRAARIVQCDADVSADDLVDIDDLADYRAKGLGGSDMSPGLLRLAEDPSVEAAVVLTDGYIDHPPKESVPFHVLWCVFARGGDASWFQPGYGDVIGIPIKSFDIETEDDL